MTLRRKFPTERDLLALADGSLPASRRVKVERAVADSPELQAVVAAQHRALSAVDDAASERAPVALRARLELLREPKQGKRPRISFGRLLPVSVPAAVVAAAVVVALVGGGVQSPTVAQAAVLATRTPTGPAPVQQGRGPTLAGVSAAGLSFPYWQDWASFRTVGVRHDSLGGRAATTVYYRRGAIRVAYTILSGPPVPVGAKSSGTSESGVAVWLLRARGMQIATWTRDGHTCVLSGTNVSAPMLVRMASWRGGL